MCRPQWAQTLAGWEGGLQGRWTNQPITWCGLCSRSLPTRAQHSCHWLHASSTSSAGRTCDGFGGQLAAVALTLVVEAPAVATLLALSAGRVGEPPARFTACAWCGHTGRHGVQAVMSRQAVAKAPTHWWHTSSGWRPTCCLAVQQGCLVTAPLCCVASLTLPVGAHIAAALCIVSAGRIGQPFCARAACSGMRSTDKAGKASNQFEAWTAFKGSIPG